MAAPARHGRDSVPLPGVAHVVLTLWTDDPALAAAADAAGVDRIGVDLERLGKRERQAGYGTWISPHREEDLVALRAALRGARLFARTNPLHPGTDGEVERLLALGAEVLMLPMFRSAAEVGFFVSLVDGRAEVVLLLETPEAVADAGAIAAVDGVGEIHIGINDLSIALGLPSRFAVLVAPETECVAAAVHSAGRRFGVGGIGRAGDRALPVPADLVYAQLARLGATASLLSRAFFAGLGDADLQREVARARERLAAWAAAGPAELDAARRELEAVIAASPSW